MMKNQKGVSGIEMIISFTLFITFVLFIFTYMSPLSMPASRALLNDLENSVMENASVNVNTTGFAINTLIDKPCFSIDENLAGKFITDSKGNEISSNQQKNITYSGEKFYYINSAGIAGNYTPLNAGCVKLSKGAGYSLSVERAEKIYYNKSLANMKILYDNNYSRLKSDLKFPAGSDFSIIVLDSNQQEIISMKKTAPRVNVLSKEFPAEILSDENGIKIIKGYVRLLVW
jgi:hypothetical protein